MDKKTVMSQFATVSEAALGKLAQSDLSKAALAGALTAKERIERLMSSMTDLDERVMALEKRVAALEKKPALAKKSTAAAKRTTSATTAKKKAPASSKASPSSKPAAQSSE